MKIIHLLATSSSWKETETGSQTWYAEDIDWPVNWLMVDGIHAFDYRFKDDFDKRECGPYWSNRTLHVT